MKKLLFALIAGIVIIAYLNNAPHADDVSVEAVAEPEINLDDASPDDLLALAFRVTSEDLTNTAKPSYSPQNPTQSTNLHTNLHTNRHTNRQAKTAKQTTGRASISKIAYAYKNRKSDVQVHSYGTVLKVLTDDLTGSRHQRFIVKLGNQQSLLISHNIDLSSKINNLKQGDYVEFYGEYEWNNKGGLVHWTHKDPKGKHVDGWLKHQNRTYQ